MLRIEPFEKYPEKDEDWFETHKFFYESKLQAKK
jgi:hypothetical protein